MKHLQQGMRLSLLVIFAIAANSCATSRVSVPAQGIHVPADFAGVAHAGDTGTQEEYALLEYAAVKWTLRTFDWNRVQPGPEEWDFSFPDAYINGLNNAGIKVVGLLAYDNGWAKTDTERKGRYIDTHQLPYYLEYVRRMTERYKGKVAAWCIWNEPNMKHFWRGTNEEFFELTRETARVIREADSEVTIIGGAFNRVLTMPKKFIRGLFTSGAMEQVDIIAFHPYHINPAQSATAYNSFRDIVADYGFQDKIWVTEMGYPTGGLYPSRVSEKKFPDYIIKTMVLLAASGTDRIIWYQMFDRIERERFNSEHYFGLTRSIQDYTSKGLEAFRLCANYFSNSVCYDAINNNIPGITAPIIQEGNSNTLRAFLFNKSNSAALVIWNESFFSRKVTLNLPGTEHLMHNIVTGESNPVSQEIQINAGKSPLFITWRSNQSE